MPMAKVMVSYDVLQCPYVSSNVSNVYVTSWVLSRLTGEAYLNEMMHCVMQPEGLSQFANWQSR